MSEKEKNTVKTIMKTIGEALPNMSDFDKGYFLGVAESSANNAKSGIKSGEPKEMQCVS